MDSQSNATAKGKADNCRLLTDADAPAVVDLCARHPQLMLTTRMNLESFGYNGPHVRSWGAFEPEERGGAVMAVMLRFGNIAVVADPAGASAHRFAQIVDSESGVAGVRGNVEAIAALRSALKRYRPVDWEDSQFMLLTDPPVISEQALAMARRAVPADLDRLAALYEDAGAMYRSRDNVARKLDQSRIFVVEEPRHSWRPARIVSSALLNVEGADAAMIGGVFTLPSARGHGYAAACTAALAIDIRQDGKLPCLFYENPVAGRVYTRLGFTNAGEWAVLYLTPRRTPAAGK
jgi:predicted GNAT family acetyltransferase